MGAWQGQVGVVATHREAWEVERPEQEGSLAAEAGVELVGLQEQGPQEQRLVEPVAPATEGTEVLVALAETVELEARVEMVEQARVEMEEQARAALAEMEERARAALAEMGEQARAALAEMEERERAALEVQIPVNRLA